MFYATVWSLLPPITAIVLALVTKEVYSSLFIGILFGGLLYSGFDITAAAKHIFVDGMMGNKVLASSGNIGILIFLVALGTLVVLMNRAGGSAAFGRWASGKIRSQKGAGLATILLGALIFVDDYFNCLAVGSVMRPLTDRQGVSRVKLAYLIDATAAPVCIIAPISSWAAAVSGFVEGANGLELFIRAIPYNFYALLTIVMTLTLTIGGFDYGPMKKMENVPQEKDVPPPHSAITGTEKLEAEEGGKRGHVLHLVLPVAVLVASCIIGMIYTGGFFGGVPFVTAFSECDSSTGLVYGSVFALLFTMFLCLVTRTVKFHECMDALPEGFKSMVPAVLILTFAWTLKAMTDSLGAAVYVERITSSFAGGVMNFLPAIIFLIACFLSFSTGTSWGTFGILIPIVVKVFSGNVNSELLIISISACMAGAVFGDHCSPISDTSIMASAGAQCSHIDHVSTQLPYAATAAFVAFICFIIAGFVQNWMITLPIGVALMICVLLAIRALSQKAPGGKSI